MPQTTLEITTSGPGLYEFTDGAAGFVDESGLETGLLTVFVRHTSCSLLIQENADPDVRRRTRHSQRPADARRAHQ